jgi:hypothetical protein
MKYVVSAGSEFPAELYWERVTDEIVDDEAHLGFAVEALQTISERWPEFAVS